MSFGMKATNDQIQEAYTATGSVWMAATKLGMCGQSVHERLVKMGTITPMNIFSEAERGILLENYTAAADAGQLEALAKSMGRTKQFICRQAKALKLTNPTRNKMYMSERNSEAMKRWHAINEHPRGMLGKKHTKAVCEAMSKISKEKWNVLTDDERDARILKQVKAKAAAGKVNPPINREGASWKAGWREIGGQRKYFRSAWEANYARYLQTLVDDGKIVSWEHEAQTFWFEGIKRGVMSYLPDFRVVDTEGGVTFHEVKGWMDARSKTTLSRMAKYHPEIAMILVDAEQYKAMRKIYAYTIDGWEK